MFINYLPQLKPKRMAKDKKKEKKLGSCESIRQVIVIYLGVIWDGESTKCVCVCQEHKVLFLQMWKKASSEVLSSHFWHHIHNFLQLSLWLLFFLLIYPILRAIYTEYGNTLWDFPPAAHPSTDYVSFSLSSPQFSSSSFHTHTTQEECIPMKLSDAVWIKFQLYKPHHTILPTFMRIRLLHSAALTLTPLFNIPQKPLLIFKLNWEHGYLSILQSFQFDIVIYKSFIMAPTAPRGSLTGFAHNLSANTSYFPKFL